MEANNKNVVGNFNVFKVGGNCHIGDVIMHYKNTNEKDIAFVIILTMTNKDFQDLYGAKIKSICVGIPDTDYYIPDDDDEYKIEKFLEESFEETIGKLNSRYFETPSDWTPFGKKSISNILEDFFRQRPIEKSYIIPISFENNPMSQIKEPQDKQDYLDILSKSIIIIDSISLLHTFYQKEVKKICEHMIGGFLSTNCDSHTLELKKLSKLMMKRTMYVLDNKRMYEGFHDKIHFNMGDEKEFHQRLLNTCMALNLNLKTGAFKRFNNTPNSSNLGYSK